MRGRHELGCHGSFLLEACVPHGTAGPGMWHSGDVRRRPPGSPTPVGGHHGEPGGVCCPRRQCQPGADAHADVCADYCACLRARAACPPCVEFDCGASGAGVRRLVVQGPLPARANGHARFVRRARRRLGRRHPGRVSDAEVWHPLRRGGGHRPPRFTVPCFSGGAPSTAARRYDTLRRNSLGAIAWQLESTALALAHGALRVRKEDLRPQRREPRGRALVVQFVAHTEFNERHARGAERTRGAWRKLLDCAEHEAHSAGLLPLETGKQSSGARAGRHLYRFAHVPLRRHAEQRSKAGRPAGLHPLPQVHLLREAPLYKRVCARGPQH
mmetsp:Transcript_58210/g.162303  ORF Transcript_58210/g.162303 Transcript_58210/m.162303 type:complete len:328 (+) Transcript_58210:61-1044(+)